MGRVHGLCLIQFYLVPRQQWMTRPQNEHLNSQDNFDSTSSFLEIDQIFINKLVKEIELFYDNQYQR